MGSYDLSETAASLPLTLEELDALLSDDIREVLRPRSAARVLVQRARATVVDRNESVQRLNFDVQRVGEARKYDGAPEAVALRALSRLSADSHQHVFSVHADQLLQQLREVMREAAQEKLAAQAMVRCAQAVLELVASSPDVPEHLKAQVAAVGVAVPRAEEPRLGELRSVETPFQVVPAAPTTPSTTA